MVAKYFSIPRLTGPSATMQQAASFRRVVAVTLVISSGSASVIASNSELFSSRFLATSSFSSSVSRPRSSPLATLRISLSS